jgi:endonuclease YncB( thermonuclease family)
LPLPAAFGVANATEGAEECGTSLSLDSESVAFATGGFRSLLIVAAIVAGSALAGEIEPGRIRVIDGDTVALGSVTYRLVGFDAPESGERARCASEAALGERATVRLRAIVASSVTLAPVPCACRAGTEGTVACNYGRRCAVLISAGRDVAGIMTGEGLARPYVCARDRCPRRGSWCP